MSIPVLKRSPSTLEEGVYDLLVVGGGIHGLGIAWDAALRGLRTALVERDDFGAGNTAGCFRILHGGLRYLQHLDLRRLRSSVREQKIIRRIAPHFITPLPVLVPAYGYGKKGPEFLRSGMFLYEQLSRNRNEGVDGQRRLPKHSCLSAKEVSELFPGLPTEGLRAGVIFYDAQMRHCERLTLAVAKGAAKAGASLCNYCELSGLEQSSSEYWSVKLSDRLREGEWRLRAKAIVNVSGSASEEVLRRLGASRPKPARQYVRGIQLVLPKIQKNYSIALESGKVDSNSLIRRGGRSYFLVPWEDSTLAGTYEELSPESTKSFAISADDKLRFLEELRTAYRSDIFEPGKVRASFGGLIPLERGAQSPETYKVERDDEIEIHPADRPLLSVTGVKYTTFRELAELSVDKICTLLQRAELTSSTAETPLPGGDSFFSAEKGSAEETHLRNIYGAESQELLSLGTDPLRFIGTSNTAQIRERPEPDAKVLPVQIRYAVQAEMCVRLSDLILRRTNLGLQGLLRKDQLVQVADIMGEELGWSPQQGESEVAAMTPYCKASR